MTKFDGFVKSRFYSGFVIPAKAGIQLNQAVLGSRLRGSDGFLTFYEIIKFQIPNKLQSPNSNLQTVTAFWSLLFWLLFGIWYLGFGASIHRDARIFHGKKRA
jgi:hypothetical protein